MVIVYFVVVNFPCGRHLCRSRYKHTTIFLYRKRSNEKFFSQPTCCPPPTSRGARHMSCGATPGGAETAEAVTRFSQLHFLTQGFGLDPGSGLGPKRPSLRCPSGARDPSFQGSGAHSTQKERRTDLLSFCVERKTRLELATRFPQDISRLGRCSQTRVHKDKQKTRNLTATPIEY